MFSLDKLISMGFTISQATVINKLFKRVGYAAKFTAEDLVAGATVPENKIFQIKRPNLKLGLFYNLNSVLN